MLDRLAIYLFSQLIPKRMKSTIILSILFAISTMAIAQSKKENLSQQVKETYSWEAAVILDNMVTLNFSPTFWDAVLDDKKYPLGSEYFYDLGSALADCNDYMFDKKWKERCDPYAYPSEDTKTDCEKEIIANKSKTTVVVNAADIKYTDKNYPLILTYITNVKAFMRNANNVYGFNRGWRPKTKELHIILTIVDRAKDVTVAWTPDGKTATITCPANNEVTGWIDKIGLGLERGGTKSK